MPAGETIIGDLPCILQDVDECLSRPTGWDAQTLALHRERQVAAVMTPGTGFTPGRAMGVVAEATASARQ